LLQLGLHLFFLLLEILKFFMSYFHLKLTLLANLLLLILLILVMIELVLFFL